MVIDENAVKFMPRWFLALLICATAGAQADAEDPEHIEFFEKRIRPLLAAHCYPCHSSRAATVFGEFRLDSAEALLEGGRSGPAVVPGDPDASRLIRAVRYDSEGIAMPPTGKLGNRDIEALTEWVRLGAPWAGGRTRRIRERLRRRGEGRGRPLGLAAALQEGASEGHPNRLAPWKC